MAQHNTTQHDTTRHDTTRHDTTRHDTTRHDTTRHDTNLTYQSTTKTDKSQDINELAGVKERLDFNQDFKLDWQDPDETKDGYQLKWIGKNYAKLQAGTATTTSIIPDSEYNEENKNSENIFLTGDNIDILKHLQSAYSNKIKMIYIDPPYNTGSDGFVYNDKFEFTDEQLKAKMGLTDDEIKRLHVINRRSSHSAWLTFMYPRLKLARNLLKDDGVIFISIDDNEQANLKLLCDEIFGEGNVETITWHKVGDDSGRLKITHRLRR
ncbi:MAG: site-specific DNA-methyltransferase, partial [Campylobacteraceae bacterium]|nr:site-specific DNA-methyltransferase [Campylobacteraceae bacterium]